MIINTRDIKERKNLSNFSFNIGPNLFKDNSAAINQYLKTILY